MVEVVSSLISQVPGHFKLTTFRPETKHWTKQAERASVDDGSEGLEQPQQSSKLHPTHTKRHSLKYQAMNNT